LGWWGRGIGFFVTKAPLNDNMGDSGFCRGNRSLINWIILPQSLLFKEGSFTIASQRTIAIKEERNNMSGRVINPTLRQE
jgi:hypothetical protein